MNVDVHVLQSRGTHRQIGMEMGVHLLERGKEVFFESISKPEVDVSGMEEVFNKWAPHLIEEVKGLAESVQIPYEKAAAWFSGYDVPKMEAMGCTAYATPSFYVRNYDFSPDFYDGVFSLIQSDSVYASAGYSLQGIGRHEGVNEQGLVIGLHFVSFLEYQKGISAWTAVRIVLDTCSSVEEAVKLLTLLPHAACYNFSIADKDGDQAVVEASPSNVKVRNLAERFACSNHFIQDELSGKNRSYTEGSKKRLQLLKEYDNQPVTCREMFDWFRDPASPLFFTAYDQLFGTLHTFAYSFESDQIMTAIARSEEVLAFSWSQWINGTALETTRIYGEIVT